MSEELRDYEQALSHYQQALDIYIEYGDRYSQASTYGQLGLLAEAQNDYPQAQQQLQQALKVFVESNDQHSTVQTLNNLNRIYGVTQDEELLSSVAEILGATTDEVQQLFEKLSDGEEPIHINGVHCIKLEGSLCCSNHYDKQTPDDSIARVDLSTICPNS